MKGVGGKGATKIGREVKGEEIKGDGGMGKVGKEGGKKVQTKRKPKMMKLEEIGRGKKMADVKGG